MCHSGGIPRLNFSNLFLSLIYLNFTSFLCNFQIQHPFLVQFLENKNCRIFYFLAIFAPKIAPHTRLRCDVVTLPTPMYLHHPLRGGDVGT